jgi:hypothetical protein
VKLEARIWAVLSRVLILWLDRFFTHLLPLSIIVFLIFLFSETARLYDGVFIGVMIFTAGVWAIADLARGIELDYQYKDTTLRDSIIQSLKKENNE